MKHLPCALIVSALLSSSQGRAEEASEPRNGQSIAPLPARVTFAEHIAPLVYAHCTECHRAGEVAPFPLQTYHEVKKRGRMIRAVTESRFMPPWHPVPGHGEFEDARGLGARDIALIARWVESGMEEGDPEKCPTPPEFPEGWHLGEPDLIVEMASTYEVPAGGPDIYRNFVIPLALEEDKWVTAIELRPTARTAVHHCLFHCDESGAARRLDGADGQPGFDGMGFRRMRGLGGWAVGGIPKHLPLGLARLLPKSSDLVLATHFHPSGKAERETSTVGLYFAERAPERTITGFQVPPDYGFSAGIDIPPGAADFKIEGTFVVPVDLELVTVAGHAHYLCRVLDAEATLPDGTTLPLFRIDDWDFNWQNRYTYKEPVYLPKGSVIRAEITYDNSEGNPRNPHSPPQRVQWGLQSTDEMGSVIFAAVAAREEDYPALRGGIRREWRRGHRRGGLDTLRRALELGLGVSEALGSSGSGK